MGRIKTQTDKAQREIPEKFLQNIPDLKKSGKKTFNKPNDEKQEEEVWLQLPGIQ